MTEELTMWKPERYVERDGGLRVDYTPTRVRLSREEGEADIRRIVNTSEKEGCWLFDEDKELWYNATPHSDKNGAIMLGGDLSEFGRRLTHYHTHPRRGYLKSLALVKRKIRDPKSTEFRIGMFGAAVDFALPSPDRDMSSFTITRRLSKDCEIEFRIGTPFGMATTRFFDGAILDRTERLYAEAVNIEVSYHLGRAHTTLEKFLGAYIEKVNTTLVGVLTLELKPYE